MRGYTSNIKDRDITQEKLHERIFHRTILVYDRTPDVEFNFEQL